MKILFHLFWPFVADSKWQSPETIRIHITESELTTSVGEQKIVLHVVCKNESNKTLLLYGINGGYRNLPAIPP